VIICNTGFLALIGILVIFNNFFFNF